MTDPRTLSVFQQARDVLYNVQERGQDVAQAMSVLNQYRQHAALKGDGITEGHLLLMTGVINSSRARFRSAVHSYEQALALFNAQHCVSDGCLADMYLGQAHRALSNYVPARAHLQRALSQAPREHRNEIEARVKHQLGQLLLSVKDAEHAQTVLQESLDACDASWLPLAPWHNSDERAGLRCEILCALTESALATERETLAWQYARDAMATADTLVSPLRLGYAARAMGNAASIFGWSGLDASLTDPDVYYRIAHEAFVSVANEAEAAHTLFAQANSKARRGKRRSSALLFERAMVIYSRLGMTEDATRAADAQLDVM